MLEIADTNYSLRMSTWLFEEALPLWASVGTDLKQGGFHERLLPDGTPTGDPRRARLVARQIYAFAVAERLGWRGAARARLHHGLAFLLERQLSSDGVAIALIRPDGTVLDERLNLYDQAFVLFALAHAYRCERLPEILSAAHRLRGQIVTRWRHPGGGFRASLPAAGSLCSNPHMHLLEAALAWTETEPDIEWNNLADEVVELAMSRFVAPRTGAIHEYFAEDWTPLTDDRHDVVEPGHQFEWAWLLFRWGILRRRDDASVVASRLVEIGEIHGVANGLGLAVNELKGDLSVRVAIHRLWPQTERIKAAIIHAEFLSKSGVGTLPEGRIAEAVDGLTRFLDHPLRGSWWEHLDESGRPLLEPSRASSLYHIICAVDELLAAAARRNTECREAPFPAIQLAGH